MAISRDDIFRKALALAPSDRAELVGLLIDSLDEGVEQDSEAIDALYGLEPVFEAGAESSPGLTSFVKLQCPYCGESFETAVDWSVGAFRYIEDCHVCCQPIELAGDVDDDGAPLGVTATRS